MWSDYPGHMGWMWIWWLVGLAVFVAGIWAVTRVAAPRRPDGRESPETILKQRYARGELDREEYERRLKDLRM
jgi:putative membrane protein